MRKHLYLLGLCFLTTGAYAQKISTKNTIIDCKQVTFKHPVTALFTMTNSGDKPLLINSVKTSCGCTTASFPTTPVAAGASLEVSVTYDAKQMGHFYKQIAIYSNAAKPAMLAIKGVVTAEPAGYNGNYPFALGALSADRNDILFDNVNQGDMPIAEINIRNDGDKVARPVLMSLPAYLAAEVQPARIAPGRTGKVVVQLNSSKLRDLGLTQTTVYLGLFPGDKISQEKGITVSTVALPAFKKLTAKQRRQAPKLRLSDGQLNLGSFQGAAKKRGFILLTNKGNSPLTIHSLQMFTTGLEVSLNKTELQPGESTRLKITAEAEGLKKAQQKPRILMITNDPDNAKVVINVNVKP